MISLTFLFLAAIFNGCCDTIAHHFRKSFFAEVRNPALWVWLQSDWLDAHEEHNPDKPYKSFRKLAPLRDGWHCAKACMIVCIIGSIITFKPILPQWWTLAGIYLLSWGVSFNLVYFLLILPKWRTWK